MDIIGYERVSTKEQGESGLGLDGQRTAIERFAAQSKARILKIYREVESGRRSDNRPALQDALSHARRARATLVVAKLDRLSRNVKFLATVFESGVEFACVDLPNANRLTLHVMSAIAEHEAKTISERTRAALAELRAKGIKLGSARPDHWKGREHLRLAGLAKGRAVAASLVDGATREAYADLLPMMKKLRVGGSPLREIAGIMNNDGLLTRRGKLWTATQVARVLGEL